MSFSVWAPTPESVQVRVGGVDHEMKREGDWWR
ncbi:maltooligosyltrehalose trehalohydrolase, partial [Lentzea jiangxiensis]